MAFIPIIGSAISLASNLFGNLEEKLNSSEHNFKKALTGLLKQAGLPPQQLQAIEELLNHGKDEQIGDKLRALMSTEPPIIPPELAPVMAELAQQKGVPRSSIDTEMLAEPIEAEEAQQKIGPMLDHTLRSLGRPTLGEQQEQMVSEFEAFVRAMQPGLRG